MRLVKKIFIKILYIWNKRRFPNIDKKSSLHYSAIVSNPKNLYMAENTSIAGGAVIMNTRANFIMKKWSGAAIDFLVVTGNHLSVVGKNLKQVTDKVKDEIDINHKMDQDVVVDEDVWIGSRVTLLSGAHVGRGCEIGSNAVIRGTIPPYSIVVGNPAKVIGFRFTPEEIIEHEIALYDEEDRLPLELLEKNYQKFFFNRTKEINSYLKI